MNPSVSLPGEGGRLEGVRSGDVVHFRGIPYARAARFGVPESMPAWDGVRDASRDGPICPQGPSRLAPVMGDPPAQPQDEACLTLNVTTPVVEAEPRPVLVWLHGGAYVVGSGSSPWYRPDALVTEGDVVVVTVNYRLGVLGYLRLEGVSPGNLGLLDQQAALAWVAKNIRAFGGDPGRITVFGESAGAHSIAALLAIPDGPELFRRAILQSGHLGLGFVPRARAERVGRAFRDAIGDADLRRAPVERILAAQEQVTERFGRPAGLNSAPIFGPIAGVAPLPEGGAADIARAVARTNVDLVIGTTTEEMRAFFDLNAAMLRLRAVPAVGARLFDSIMASVTRRVFETPARKLADVHAGAGAAVYRYRFAWTPPREAHGTCHTMDLPFVFGNRAAWCDSPMLGGAAWDQVDALGRQMRRAWTRFAWTGDPNAPGDPEWARHTPGAATARTFR